MKPILLKTTTIGQCKYAQKLELCGLKRYNVGFFLLLLNIVNTTGRPISAFKCDIRLYIY
jgi:hypothetical protein